MRICELQSKPSTRLSKTYSSNFFYIICAICVARALVTMSAKQGIAISYMQNK